MKNHLKPLLLLLCCAHLFFTACNKKSDDPTPEEEANTTNKGTVPMGRLAMHLHNFIESTEVDAYGQTFPDGDNRKITLNMGQVYLSNFELIRLDGSVYAVPNTVILKNQIDLHYVIGEVPVGNYKTVRFTIGLDANTNQKTPSTDASDPLNQSSMWFGSAAQPEGYVFANIQGKIDTTEDASSSNSQMQPFSYRIGTNRNVRKVTMPDNTFAVMANLSYDLHMYIDYSRLFRGIQLSNPANLIITTPADNSTNIATQLANNLTNMFVYE